MTLLYIFCFLFYAFALGSVPYNAHSSFSIITGDNASFERDDGSVAYGDITNQEATADTSFAIASEAESAVTEAIPTPDVYLATNIDPTKTDCRTDCAVGLPAATVYKWQQVTITATTVVETVVHIVNPQYYPNATGTRRLQQLHDAAEEKRDRYTVNNGVVVTTLDLGYRKIGVTYPTPVTITPTTMTLIGGPPATISQEAPACTSAAVQSVNLTTIDDAQLFAYGESEIIQGQSSPGNLSIAAQPNKIVRDTIHWRLVPEYYRQVDVARFRGQFPYIMALDICGAFGPPEQTASLTQLSGVAWSTLTTTETFTGSSKDPRINEIITLTRKAGTSLEGPRPTLASARVENSITAKAPEAQNSGIAAQMVSEAPQGPSGLLIGPAPKPAPIEQQIQSGGLAGLAKSTPRPTIPVADVMATSKPSPVLVNGHMISQKEQGVWEVDNGQILQIDGPEIELESGTHGGAHGGSGHKMKVGLTSGKNGREVLIVDGASMTVAGTSPKPAATGSSVKNGKMGSGSPSNGGSSGNGGFSGTSQVPGSPKGKPPTQYTGSASLTRQNQLLVFISTLIGLMLW